MSRKPFKTTKNAENRGNATFDLNGQVNVQKFVVVG